MSTKINVNNTEITIITVDEKDYISLTDMAKLRKVQAGQQILLRTG